MSDFALFVSIIFYWGGIDGYSTGISVNGLYVLFI